MRLASILTTFEEGHGDLLRGLLTSVQLTAVSLAVGFPLALLFALCVMSRARVPRALGLVVVEIGRGVPLLVVLQIMYFGLPDAGLTLGAFTAAAAALAFQTGAYGSEIFRASLQAVPTGQREAAAAAGLSSASAFLDVILPQAIRIAIPPMMNIAIAIFLATSLAFVITVPELMSKAYEYGTATFKYLDVFVLAGVMYAAITLVASAAVAGIEKRLSRHL